MSSDIKINISGGQASFGTISQGDGNALTGQASVVASTVDLPALAADLQRLQRAMASRARGGEHMQSVDDMTKAAGAAHSPRDSAQSAAARRNPSFIRFSPKTQAWLEDAATVPETACSHCPGGACGSMCNISCAGRKWLPGATTLDFVRAPSLWSVDSGS